MKNIKICEWCKKEYVPKATSKEVCRKYRFCSRVCYFSLVTKDLPKSKICNFCGIEFLRKKGFKGKTWLRIKFCSRLCMSLSFRGDGSPSWKGGLTELKECIRKSGRHKDYRKSVFIRDNHTCQNCGIRNCKGLGGSIRLELDHFPIAFSDIISVYKIKEWSDADRCELLWNVNNARTLCSDCHRGTDNYGYKQILINKKNAEISLQKISSSIPKPSC